MRTLTATLLATLCVVSTGCSKDLWVKGEINGEAFAEPLEAIYVGSVDSDETNARILISTYHNACQNYQAYVQLQQYEADNALLSEEDLHPNYLLFTAYFDGIEPLAEHEVLAVGETYDDGPSSLNGRYRSADGAGQFDNLDMSGGLLSLEGFEAGDVEGQSEMLLVGTFTAEFTNGDSVEGGFSAAPCDP